MTPKELEEATWAWEDEAGEAAAGYGMSMEQRRQLVCATDVDAMMYFTPNAQGIRDYNSFMGRPIIDLHTASEITILSKRHLDQLQADQATFLAKMDRLRESALYSGKRQR